MAFRHAQLLVDVTCLVLCACATVSVTSVTGMSVTMTTSLGDVTGFVAPGDAGEDDVNVFYGIPFAKPPVGALRFRPPECPAKWSSPRDATHLPNSCWQAIDSAFDRFPGVEMWNPNTPRSEDCLYLNAWVPATTTKKPIMVWIFGGGFWAGTTTLAVYDAVKMAARKDVIVVSIAYRLGVFGFLNSGESSAPGNMGMLDQVAALHWVKANAEFMGGDPDKITLFGESAGAASVGYHLLSPLSKDLFNSGIMLSSSAMVNWGVQSLQTARGRFLQLAKGMGCSGRKKPAQLVECLRGVNASVLADSQWNVVSGLYFDAPFALVVDHDFLPDHPDNLVRDGKIKDANVIAGVVKNEGIYWLLYGFPDVFQKRPVNPVNATQFSSVVDGILAQYYLAKAERERYKNEDGDDKEDDEVVEVEEEEGEKEEEEEGADDKSEDVKALVKRLAEEEYYYGRPPLHRDYLTALDAMSGDILFKCAVRDYCAQHKAHRKGNVFQYSFEHRISSNPWPAWLGVAHGYEIEAVLGLPFLHPANYTDQERVLSDRVMDYFTTFARNGDPNVDSQSAEAWPQFELDTQHYRILNLEDSNSDGLRYGECRFWDVVVPAVSMEKESSEVQPLGDPDAAPIVRDGTMWCLLVGVLAAAWNLRP